MTKPIEVATERLLKTVDDLPDSDWQFPSVCVGWSRAHVIAHVALNAEGLGAVVESLVTRDPTTTMYSSNTARDADIATLAAYPPARIRDRLHASAAFFAEAISGLATVPSDATFDRTPGGIVMKAANVPLLRLREVEIHHADLAAGYTHADWPEANVVTFLDHDAGRYDGAAFTARATDLDQTWLFGAVEPESPEVAGRGSAIAWLATGRDPGDALTSSTGVLPVVAGR